MVDKLLADHEPWEVAAAVREAAVVAVPTLDQLIGHLKAWEVAEQQDDSATWLDRYASIEQFVELVEYSNNPEHDGETRPYMSELAGDYFTQTLEPPQLLKAWHYVINTPSDLTDQEFELLVPFLPRQNKARVAPLSNEHYSKPHLIEKKNRPRAASYASR